MKVVLLKDYRPADVKGAAQPEVKAGETIDLPDDEAKNTLELGIAQMPEDAAKSPAERAAITTLTDLGYTVTPPKTPAQAKATAATPVTGN